MISFYEIIFVKNKLLSLLIHDTFLSLLIHYCYWLYFGTKKFYCVFFYIHYLGRKILIVRTKDWSIKFLLTKQDYTNSGIVSRSLDAVSNAVSKLRIDLRLIRKILLKSIIVFSKPFSGITFFVKQFGFYE